VPYIMSQRRQRATWFIRIHSKNIDLP
jgi:hypothetical protein